MKSKQQYTTPELVLISQNNPCPFLLSIGLIPILLSDQSPFTIHLQHFPQFDGDDEEDRIEACGPMKVLQMAEVEKVLGTNMRMRMRMTCY